MGAMICLGWGLLWFVFWAAMIHSRRQERLRLYDLVEQAIREGRSVPPELLSRFGCWRPLPQNDVRAGLVLIALGLGLAIGGVINFKTYPGPHPQLFYGPYGLFPIPMFIGLAFLLMARMNKNTHDGR